MHANKQGMISLLQVGRAVAALLVVCFHAHFAVKAYTGSDAFDVFSFGWSGVQFFFVLSGFIIYRVHRCDIGKPDKLRSYLYKRLVRIYPLYILVTLLFLPVWILLPTEFYHDDPVSIIMSLALLPQPHHPHLTVAWTLVHEIAFYAFFALAIMDKRGLWILGLWFAAIAVANLITPLILPVSFFIFPVSFFLSINNLLFGFGIFGAVLAEKLRLGLPILITGTVIFMIAATADLLGMATESPRLLILMFGFGAFLIVLSSLCPRVDRIAQCPILIFLGNASYSIYLAHYPAISVACKTLEAMGSASPFVTFAAATILGVLSGIGLHLAVEKPIMALFNARALISLRRPRRS